MKYLRNIIDNHIITEEIEDDEIMLMDTGLSNQSKPIKGAICALPISILLWIGIYLFIAY